MCVCVGVCQWVFESDRKREKEREKSKKKVRKQNVGNGQTHRAAFISPVSQILFDRSSFTAPNCLSFHLAKQKKICQAKFALLHHYVHLINGWQWLYLRGNLELLHTATRRAEIGRRNMIFTVSGFSDQ